MNVRAPAISYSLPNAGDSVTISIANGVAGAWSALEDFATALSSYGQVFNTWGEFSTGNSATVDVSREANMAGSFMVLRVANNGCTADMGTCVYACTGGANSCGAADTYGLFNCATGSQAGANQYMVNGNPTGGCQGWSNGGHVDVWLMS